MQSVKLKSELQTISHAISSASFGGLTEGGGESGVAGKEYQSDNRCQKKKKKLETTSSYVKRPNLTAL